MWYFAISSEEKYGRDSLVIPVDFLDGLEIYNVIAEQLKDLSIAVLGTSVSTLVF